MGLAPKFNRVSSHIGPPGTERNPIFYSGPGEVEDEEVPAELSGVVLGCGCIYVLVNPLVLAFCSEVLGRQVTGHSLGLALTAAAYAVVSMPAFFVLRDEVVRVRKWNQGAGHLRHLIAEIVEEAKDLRGSFDVGSLERGAVDYAAGLERNFSLSRGLSFVAVHLALTGVLFAMALAIADG